MTNSERSPSYIGVSGVVNPEQQQMIEESASSLGLTALENNHTIKERKLVLGVKATRKTQYLDHPNKYGPAWYPVGAEAFSNALSANAEVMAGQTIGVAQMYLEPEHVDHDLVDFNHQVIERGRPWLGGVQFDLLPWQDKAFEPAIINLFDQLKYKEGLKIFLQCHAEALSALGRDGAIRRLGHYAAVVDYVLFDTSSGRGVPLDTTYLKPLLEVAHSSAPLERVGLAIAGGLSGPLIRDHLPELLAEFPNISWDAEAALHPETTTNSRPLDLALVIDYLKASSEIIYKSK